MLPIPGAKNIVERTRNTHRHMNALMDRQTDVLMKIVIKTVIKPIEYATRIVKIHLMKVLEKPYCYLF